jgi:hypothetical protein
VTSTSLRTEFLLQFWKQWEDSAILLVATDHNKKDKTKKQRMTEKDKKNQRKGQTGKD